MKVTLPVGTLYRNQNWKELSGFGWLVLFIIMNLFFANDGLSQIQLRGEASSTAVINHLITINKPAGLQVHDVMIANIMQAAYPQGSLSNALLGGWSVIDGRSLGTGNAFGSFRRTWWGTVLYKTATETDVSQSSFTFILNPIALEAAGDITAYFGVDVTGGVTETGAGGGPFDCDPGIITGGLSAYCTATSLHTISANTGLIMLGQHGNDDSWNASLSDWHTYIPGTLEEIYDVNYSNLGIGAAWAIDPEIDNTSDGSAFINNLNFPQGLPSHSGGILLALKSCTPPPIDPIGGGAPTVYLGSQTPAFTDATTGGSWSIIDGSGSATIDQNGIATGDAVGLVHVVYTVTDEDGCSGTVTVALNVIEFPLPVISTRFANPSFGCDGQYCVDVEFKCNQPNQQLFGMNVRFFYPDSILELIGFSDFHNGYGIAQPDPPDIVTNSAAGAAFNFTGPAEWVNGAIQLDNPNIITYLDTVQWTKLFQVCFEIDDPNPNMASFCPPLVWDIEQDINNGGYFSGDDGVVITVIDPDPFIESSPAYTSVDQFNWMYTGSGSAPFGEPVSNNCTTLTPDCSPYISCPSGRILECGESTSPVNTGYATSSDNCTGDPIITYSDTQISGSCPQQYSIQRRWITTNACGFSDTCVQTISVIDTEAPIITCPSNITVFCPATPVFATPIATDGCDPSVIITFTDVTFAGSCPDQYIINRTWKATDHCGNFSTCIATIQYKDETAPSITCPVNITINCQEDNSSVHTGLATATDNCSSVLVTQTQTSSQNPDVDACDHYTYVISRLWTATDACGNSTSCMQTINVRDVTGPVITCPSNITVLYPGSTLPVNTGNATGLDNCDSGLSMTFTDVLSPLVCPSINKITRTWKATDACGNSSTCQQTIVIDDRGSICGSVHDDLGQPIAGVEIKLVADVNSNQMYDGVDTLVATLFSNAGTGQFCFQQIRPCSYILVEVQPATYGELSDFDSTPDPDGDDSGDGPDNQIPVNLTAAENDGDNNFIDIKCPTQLPVITPDTICANGSVVFQINAIPLGALTYSWDFGSGSNPLTGIGLGPHTVSYITTTNNQANGAVITMNIQKTGCPNLSGQVSSVKINPYPNAAINQTSSGSCYFTNRTFQPVQAEIPGATYSWTFGSGAVPLSATGYGPHVVYYTSAGAKTVNLVIMPNEPGAQCPDSSSVMFTITSCPSNITGSVKTVEGTGIGGVTIRLYNDINYDGMPDDTIWVISKNTVSGTGNFSMTLVTPGNYVLVELQPFGYVSFNDRDISPDGDIVPNIDSLDNIIPITVRPSLTDGGNNFTESLGPGDISGSVFDDVDGNGIPGTNEGIAGVTIKLFSDSNADGHADNMTPIAMQTTSAIGFYSFPLVPIGHYVLAETQPLNYTSVMDYDYTEDLDVPTNGEFHDDTIPVQIIIGEHDDSNYFVETSGCNLLVMNTLDSGPGSLRAAIACAADGDTIRFANSLQGMTILITSSRIEISKELTILSTLSPRISIYSQIPGLFKILGNLQVEFRQVDVVSGMTISGNMGAAFENLGNLKLHDVHLLRNPSLPSGQFLIRNMTNSNLLLSGSCLIEMY
ncbi:MAG: SdrD B-like domain-containing protein [Saprospiraceae bacterium]